MISPYSNPEAFFRSQEHMDNHDDVPLLMGGLNLSLIQFFMK
jgi:hypothetical protein